jgi:hypothetical protein
MKMRPTPDSHNGPERKRIRPDEKLPLDLNDRERELILQHTFADAPVAHRARCRRVGGVPFHLGRVG